MLASLLVKHQRESDALIIVESLARMTEPSLHILRQLIYHRFRAGDYEGTLTAIDQFKQTIGDKSLPPAIMLLRCKALSAMTAHDKDGKGALGQALLDYVGARTQESPTIPTTS